MNISASSRQHLDFKKDLEDWLKDPRNKKEYDKLKPEFELIRAIIDSRNKKGITQKVLAKRMKTKQSVISRLESGNANPSFKFVKRLAKALETDIKITFSSVQ